MKVGDKVYVELEVERIDGLDNTFRGKTKSDRKYWIYIDDIVTQLPIQNARWMMVSDDTIKWESRYVVGKFFGKFIAISNASCKEDFNYYPNSTTYWKYAKEIPTKRKLTMQEIAEKFNERVDNIEII